MERRNYEQVFTCHSLERSLCFKEKQPNWGWRRAYRLLSLLKIAKQSDSIGYYDKASKQLLAKFIGLPEKLNLEQSQQIKTELEQFDFNSHDNHGAMEYSLSDFNKGKLVSSQDSISHIRLGLDHNLTPPSGLRNLHRFDVHKLDWNHDRLMRFLSPLLIPLLKREVHHVLDSTLLLSQKEWLEAFKINNYRSQKENYILVYSVLRDPLLKKVVDFFANQLRNKVVVIDQAVKPFIKNADVNIRNAGPIEFIELLANARFVITSSFHGTCFSINFNKPFVSVCSVGVANRIESVLSLLGLKDRFINDEKDIYKISTDLNYEFSENQLQRERAKSIKVLSSSIVS